MSRAGVSPRAGPGQPAEVAHVQRHEAVAVEAVEHGPHALPGRADALDAEAAEGKSRVGADERVADGDHDGEKDGDVGACPGDVAG